VSCPFRFVVADHGFQFESPEYPVCRHSSFEVVVSKSASTVIRGLMFERQQRVALLPEVCSLVQWQVSERSVAAQDSSAY
jgi:hypothetical protein